MNSSSKDGVEITGLIDMAPLSGLQKRVIALCSLVILLDGYDIQALGLVIPRMAKDFHIAPAAFAVAISTSAIGMVLGALLFSPLADRFGRRPMLIAMMVLVGASTMGAMTATGTMDLAVWRFLTGLGLGASMPIAVALTSEYVSSKRRIALMTLMYCTAPVGAFMAGMIGPVMNAIYGWRGIFAFGGVLPLIAAVVFWFWLPEALRILLQRNPTDPNIAHQLGRIAPGFTAARPHYTQTKEAKAHAIGVLFVPRFRSRTALLWLIFMCNGFVNFSLISWLPTLLEAAGWTAGNANRVTGLIGICGIGGGQLIAWIADRGRPVLALGGTYAAVAVVFSLFAVGPANHAVWLVILLLIGVGAFGAHFTIGAFAASLYPPEVRSTGIGWASGVGRFGAIFGPIAVAGLMKLGITPAVIISFLLLPMCVCAACVAGLRHALTEAKHGR